MAEDIERETKAYLSRIRRTIEEANRLVEQVGLRVRETDRMLEQQGLTREQVLAMHFSDAQIEAANAELNRRGMDPIEKWSEVESQDFQQPDCQLPADSASDTELAERQRKFGMMMKPFQI